MDHSAVDLDGRVRLAASQFLAEQTQLTSNSVLPRTVLATGFTFDGIRVPLIGPQGIFKPAILPGVPGQRADLSLYVRTPHATLA